MRIERLLFAGLLCAVGLFASAQTTESDYRPFAEEGKKWETQVGLIMENLYSYFISGDTVINGENWKKVYNRRYMNGTPHYYSAVRDVDKKVYCIAKGSNRPRLLYDFGLKVAEPRSMPRGKSVVRCGIEGNGFVCLLEEDEKADSLLGFDFYAYLWLIKVDTVQSHGQEYRRYLLTFLDSDREPLRYGDGTGAEWCNVTWIEGVGSGAGPFLPWVPFPPYGRIYLDCTVKGGDSFSFYDVYKAEDTTEVPALDSSGIPRERDDSFYDLQGRRLTGEPGKGLYIQNGRKIIAK